MGQLHRLRIEQIEEFHMHPTIEQHGMTPVWNNTLQRFEWKAYGGLPVGTTEKITSVHAGTFNEKSLTDDYEYTCVLTGVAETTLGSRDGTAKWKKQPLFISQ